MFQGMEYVYAVYAEGSFSEAAKKLFVSQPSLSATIKRAEERIGYPIFDRSVRPLKLTECGEKYIQAAERIMSAEREFSDFVNDWCGLHTGRLTVGGSSLFSSWILPPLIGKFSQKFPEVEIELVEESTAKLAGLLQNGRIDLLIDNCKLENSVFGSSVFRKEHLLLAVPKQFAINQTLKSYRIPARTVCTGEFLDETVAVVPIEQFQNVMFIMLKPDNDTRKRADEIFRKFHITPEIVFELDQQMTAYNVTCSGMGASFISDTLISSIPSHENVVYYKLPEEFCTRNIYFYWKAGRYFSRAMEEFLATVQPLSREDTVSVPLSTEGNLHKDSKKYII